MLNARDRRIQDRVRRAKERLNSIMSDTIHFEFSNKQVLQATGKLYESDWHLTLPEYRKSEIRGYAEALFYSNHSRLFQLQRNAMLVDGVLYQGFDAWRAKHPDADASRLQNVSVAVWKSGKVYHCMPEHDWQGKTFPWNQYPSVENVA